jgi:hypothetical protein
MPLYTSQQTTHFLTLFTVIGTNMCVLRPLRVTGKRWDTSSRCGRVHCPDCPGGSTLYCYVLRVHSISMSSFHPPATDVHERHGFAPTTTMFLPAVGVLSYHDSTNSNDSRFTRDACFEDAGRLMILRDEGFGLGGQR